MTPETSPGPIVRFRRPILCALVFYWIALFVGTHIPLHANVLPGGSDKWVHFFAYAGLSFLLAFWWSTSQKLTIRHLRRLFAVVAVYAVLDELLQYPVNRSPELLDCLADWIGAVVGLGTLYWARSKLSRFWN